MASRQIGVYKSKRNPPNLKTNRKQEKTRGAPRKRNLNDPLTKEIPPGLLLLISTLFWAIVITLAYWLWALGYEPSSITALREVLERFFTGLIKFFHSFMEVR